MEKLALVVAPLILYAVVLGVRRALGRMPNRHALNVELSVALVLYFFATAGLGVFWVANQQLPPFDLHYLFGYATAALVVAHLIFNTRVVVRHFQKPRGVAGAHRKFDAMRIVRLAGYAVGVVVAFLLGMRSGTTEISSAIGGTSSPSMKAVGEVHAFSSHSRTGVVLRAPGVTWDKPVPRYLDRSSLAAVSLPEPKIDAAPGGTVTISELSTLLWATAGITDRRGGLELRAAASSGALFPTEIYVVARDVAGLAPGVYAYGPERHTLHSLGKAPPLLADLGAAEAGEPPLTLIATCVFRRSGQKYRDRAYRYAVADAGHALGNTLAAAASRDFGARMVARFDDAAVARLVGADDVEEGAVAMVAIGPGIPALRAPSALAPAGSPEASELSLGATSLAHLATSLRLVEEEPTATGSAIALPRASSPAPPVLPILERRRSVRNFSSRAVTLDELGAWLERAHAPEPALTRTLRTHVVATRVAGLEPGVYRYDPRAHTLVLARAGAFAEAAGRAALDQEVVGGAPVTVVLSMDRATLDLEGPRGYRHAFVEAGLIGARLYIATVGAGLGGSSVGAFYDEELAGLLDVPLDREWPVHIFAMGATD